MKRFSCLFVPFLAAFFAAFYSCQSDKDVSAPAHIKDVALRVGIFAAGSRTTITDTYGGAFAETWNKDVLNIYHSYRSNGTAQSLKPLNFATTATGVSSAVFSYSALTDYTYNPGQPLYAFNKLTGKGQSTPTTTGGTTATPLNLSLTGWGSQDGTLTGTQNVALYDAMAGYALTDATTGTPAALTMKHLGGIIGFHFTCDDFTNGTPLDSLAFAANAIGSSFLPTSAVVSIASDGTPTTTPTFTTTWITKGSFTPASKAIDVYLSTFPFPSIASGKLTALSTDVSNSYVALIPISSLSLSSGQVKSFAIALTKQPLPSAYSKFYAWDATDGKSVTLGTAPTNYNSITVSSSATDYSSRALYACKNCPNVNEASWYLSVPCYWDDGNQSFNGGNIVNYVCADNRTKTKCGMWFRKKTGISGFSSTTSSGITSCTPVPLSSMSLANVLALNLVNDYFFLPAVGYASTSSGSLGNVGGEGDYWSSTPGTNTWLAYDLIFFSNSVTLGTSTRYRNYGFCIWQVQ